MTPFPCYFLDKTCSTRASGRNLLLVPSAVSTAQLGELLTKEFHSTTPKESALEMNDEELDKIIELLLTNPSSGLNAYGALTLEERKQVLERAQDERINQIVAEADAESITD
jgi:hypothetical protein